MMFSKEEKKQDISINFVDNCYHINIKALDKYLSTSELIKNVFYYEGVDRSESEIIIHKSAIFEIEPEVLEELNIFRFNGLVKIVKDGIIQVQPVKFNHRFYKNPTFPLDYKRIGDLLQHEGKYYLINENQSDLVENLESYNQDNQLNSNAESQFRQIRKIKDAISDFDVGSNKDIEAYNPVFVDEISLEINPKSDDEIEVNPKLIGNAEEYNLEFNKIYDSSGEVNPTYPVDENTFLVIDEEKRDSLRKLRDYRTVSGKEEIDNFINNVDQILPGFDYSDRVIGWGEYNIPAFRRDSTNLIWITEIDDQGDESRKVKFVSEDNKVITVPEDLNTIKLKNDIEDNVGKQEESVSLDVEGNPKLSIKDAQTLLEMLEIIQEAKEENKREREDKKKDTSKDEFVIIKTSFEDTEYEEKSSLELQTNLEIPNVITNSQWNLFDYQKGGLLWMQTLYNNLQSNTESLSIGGLLADDMGLGKSLQILSYLAWLSEKAVLKKSLIVVPMTLINNWTSAGLFDNNIKGEIEKFLPNVFNPLPIRSSRDLYHMENPHYNVVITSYDTIMYQCKTEERFQRSFGVIDWDLIVCDEAQKIKNPATKRTIAVKSLKAKFKVACTATPIENHMDELWSLCDWILPGKLGSLSGFRKTYLSKSKENSNFVHKDLAQKLEGYYLRRTKEQVLSDSLKQKKINVTLLKPSQRQLQTYQELIKSYDGKNVLPMIGKMIGIMTHPNFLNKSIVDLDKDTLEKDSNKFRWLNEVLTQIRDRKEKVLIFTPSKWIQTAIRKYVAELFNIDAVIVNGDVKGNIRLSEIERVSKSEGFGVLILSPEVAGYGLTITEANNIIHFSRGWNPAKENQATDRAYRIGQDKDVNVFIPIVTWNEDLTQANYKFDSNDDYYDWDYVSENKSPEENLDVLMRTKGKLLKNFFSVASSISADELFKTFMQNEATDEVLEFENLLEILTPDEFEAYCCVLFEKMGYSTILTPISGDLGVDVVVLDYTDNKPLLLQVFKTNYSLKTSKVQEVAAAKSSYERALRQSCSLGVFSNSNVEGRTIKRLIKENDIEVFDYAKIRKLSNNMNITYSDITLRAQKREQIIYS